MKQLSLPCFILNYKVLLLSVMLLFLPSVVLAQYSGRVGDYIELPLPTLPPGGYELVSAMYGTRDPDIAVASGTNRVKILSWFSGHQTVTCEVHAVKQIVDYSGRMQEFHNYYTAAFFISCSSSPTLTPDSDPDPNPNYTAENPSNYYTDYGCWGTVTIKKGESKTFYHNFDILNANKVQSIVWSDFGSYGFYISSQSQSSCTIKGFGSCRDQKLWCLMKYGSGTYKGYYIINVIPAIEPIGITTSNPVVKLKENESYTLSYSLVPSNANINTSVTWSSDDTSIATVTSSGKITGVKSGTTYVRVKTANGKSDFCQVTVEGPTVLVSKIELNNTSLTLNPNDTKQLSATIYPSNATDTNITWLSSNTDVATVSPNGLVTAKAVGSATITCTANDGSGISASCKVNVEAATVEPTSISLPSSKNINVGESSAMSYTLYPSNATTTLTWTSDNPDIATVSSNGVVNGIKVGSTYINVRTANGKSSSCKVSVWGVGTIFTIQSEEGVALKFEVTDAEKNECVVYAPADKSSVTAVSIPSQAYLYKVTGIRDYAFRGCPNLTSVAIPNTVTSIGKWAFISCGKMKSITIPNSVVSIGGEAFSGTGLTSVTIPESVAKIENSFEGCNSLKTVSILSPHVFKQEYNLWRIFGEQVEKYILGNNITTIPDKAFYVCENLETVDIPNSVISIGARAFEECKSLISISIPNSVTSIGDKAFAYCYSLASISIPNSVTNIGEGAFENCDALISITIPSSVTKISNKTFFYCDCLTTITIPNSITSIGDEAFSGCKSLTTITIPNSVTNIGTGVFSWCTNLTSVTIPNTITSIPDYAFSHCSNLAVVDIPNWVTNIGEAAFTNCTSLTSVTIPNSVTIIPDYAFYNCSSLAVVEIPNSVTSIGYSAFHDCKKLTSVTIPNSVKSIGGTAFRRCSSLTAVDIPNSVTRIGNAAFEDCNGLTKVNISSIETWCNIEFDYLFANPLCYAHDLYLNGKKVTDLVIPNTVMRIGQYAFVYTGLASIDIPNSVTSIGEYAFYGCEGLTKVNISDVEAWCKIKFDAEYSCYANPLYYAHNLYLDNEKVTDLVIPNSVASISEYAFYECEGLTSVTLPNSVTSIGEYAFYGCEGLTKVNISSIEAWCNIHFGSNPLYYAKNLYLNGERITNLVIPNSVTSISEYAFYGCEGLTSVIIPNSVTSIGEYAFYECEGLTSVTLPNSVTVIGYGAFWGCDSINSIHAQGTDPSMYGGNYIFDNVYNSAILYVPVGTKSIYKSVYPWYMFKSIVEEEPKPDHVPGDVNSDELVNGADVVALNDVIAGKTEGGVSADTNGDGVVDEKDYNDLIARVLNNTDVVYPEHDEQCRVQMDVPAVYIKEGEKAEVLVGVSNPDDAVTLVQFDMQLPAGIKVCKSGDEYDFDIVSRTSWRYHSLYGNAVNNDTRILLASTNNRSISGSDGLLISVMIEADDSYTGGNILLKNILLVSPDHSEFRPKAVECELRNTADGIADIPMQSAGKKTFSISGQRLATPKKGINIINGKKHVVK